MDPSALARFATACGAFAPLEIAIEYHDGTVAATGVLQQPFALIGRDPTCDIALSADEIEPHAAFLQVIGGQVFVGDLGSKSGLRWHHGRHPYGWMFPGEPIRVGPFALRLLQPVSPHPAPFGSTFHPMVAGPDVPGGLPPVEIAFTTGQADRTRWPVNRVLTLIGSAPDCKIHLGGDDVAPRHCYLLHTHDGLWAVDLSGESRVAVNGTPVRFARLGEADELTVGRFVMSVTYPDPRDEDGAICFDDLPRAAPRVTEQDSSTQTARRPAGFDIPRKTYPKTEHDLDLAPPSRDEPADWNADEPTDQIHRPVALAAAHPLSEDEIAILIPSDSGELADLVANPLTLTPLPHTDTPLEVRTALRPQLRHLGELHSRMSSQFLIALRGRLAEDDVAKLIELTREMARVQSEWLSEPSDATWTRLNELNDEREAVWERLAETMP